MHIETGLVLFVILVNEASSKVYLEESSRYNFDKFGENYGTILGVPTIMKHLPLAEAMLPGNTLLKPRFGVLKSAVSFPHHVDTELVYGNPINLASADRRGKRVIQTNFRRNHDFLDQGIENLLDIKRKLKVESLTRPDFLSSFINNKRFQDEKLQNQREEERHRYPELYQYYARSNRPKYFPYKPQKDFLEIPVNKDIFKFQDSEEQKDDVKKKTLKEWFWNSQHMYDNINIRKDAPTAPPIPVEDEESVGYWSYYGQERRNDNFQ